MPSASTPGLIPQVCQYRLLPGRYSAAGIESISADKGFENAFGHAADGLEKLTGRRPQRSNDVAEAQLLITADQAPEALGDEGYRLSIGADGVRIRAAKAAGAFYGVVSLLQLLETDSGFNADSKSRLDWPCLEIEDQPRFPWRGLMLDCARYFYPVEKVLSFIDLLAMHKFNVFHWHLTEDQGWRIEIKAFPKLTEVGAWRSETVFGHNHLNGPGDGIRHGGFYSQQDIREIVAYAAQRHITVVPEIELPGHAQAALASYPNLGCSTQPLDVSTNWGIHKNVFNAGKEEVFDFLEQVLDEVLELFPSKYIHIGGDECPKDQWKTDPLCQQRIRNENLADEDELQSWFIRRIEKFLNQRGRTLIGWDEILEGGLAPNATVMSWRGEDGGVAAARAGHQVVMTPNKSVYFDYYQGDPAREPLGIGSMLPLEKVYQFEPIPEELSSEEGTRVLGAQGNIWTEYMPSYQQVQYMTLPRAAALAEVLWSPKNDRPRDFNNFKQRLATTISQYNSRGWIYRPI
jgi:hexosaminidase